jgi:hypothetical protein
VTHMLRRPRGDGYSFATGGTGGGFGGNGSGGGTGDGGAGLGGDEVSGIVPIRQSLLLQRFAVNLINANKATDKIPILLIRENAIVC